MKKACCQFVLFISLKLVIIFKLTLRKYAFYEPTLLPRQRRVLDDELNAVPALPGVAAEVTGEVEA